MSDRDVLATIETLERKLDADPSSLDAAALETWNRDFQAAVASAERGPRWPSILERAHQLSERIQTTVAGLDHRREELKAQLIAQTLGERALKAYGPSN